MLTVTLKWATQFVWKKPFLNLCQRIMSSLGLLSAKNEKKLNQKHFSFGQVKNQFGHFELLGRNFKFSLYKWKFCRTQPNSPDFWNWTHKNIPDRQHIVPVFKNCQKCQITPPYCPVYSILYIFIYLLFSFIKVDQPDLGSRVFNSMRLCTYVK